MARSSSALPRSLTKRPYDWLLALLIGRSGLASSSVWVRNSLALDYWELGLSDLDLTVLVEGDAHAALDAWSQLRPLRMLLIGGEVQIYTHKGAIHLMSYANPWELRRDPGLLRRLECLPSFANPMHRTVFLTRMLLADSGLIKFPWGRQRKWREHLQAMQLPVPATITWAYLVDLLHAQPPFDNFLRSELEETLLSSRHNSHEASALNRLIRANNHIWGEFVKEQDDQCLNDYSPQAHEFLACMVEWEIWGLSSFTPVTTNQDLAGLVGFWNIQQRLINSLRIDSKRKQWLLDGFDYLANYYRSLS